MDQQAGAPAQGAQVQANPVPQNILIQPLQNTALNTFKPKPFTGISKDAPAFLRSFERYAMAAEIQPAQKCVIFSLLVTDFAENWFNDLPVATKNNWDLLRAAFELKYVTAAHLAVKKRLLSLSTVQNPLESVEKYIERIKSVMTELDYDPQLQISIIIQGLRQEFRSYALLGLPYETVEQLVQKLSNCELSFQTQYSAKVENPTVNAVPLVPATFPKEWEKNIEDIVKRALPTPAADAKPPRTCFRCQSPNHFQRDCPQGVPSQYYQHRYPRPQPGWHQQNNRNPNTQQWRPQYNQPKHTQNWRPRDRPNQQPPQMSSQRYQGNGQRL